MSADPGAGVRRQAPLRGTGAAAFPPTGYPAPGRKEVFPAAGNLRSSAGGGVSAPSPAEPGPALRRRIRCLRAGGGWRRVGRRISATLFRLSPGIPAPVHGGRIPAQRQRSPGGGPGDPGPVSEQADPGRRPGQPENRLCPVQRAVCAPQLPASDASGPAHRRYRRGRAGPGLRRLSGTAGNSRRPSTAHWFRRCR